MPMHRLGGIASARSARSLQPLPPTPAGGIQMRYCLAQLSQCTSPSLWPDLRYGAADSMTLPFDKLRFRGDGARTDSRGPRSAYARQFLNPTA